MNERKAGFLRGEIRELERILCRESRGYFCLEIGGLRLCASVGAHDFFLITIPQLKKVRNLMRDMLIGDTNQKVRNIK